MKHGRWRQMLFWWIAFAVATFSLSHVFQATRLLTSGAQNASVWNLMLWASLLLISFLAIGYDGYVKSRREGKVTHSIWLYEKLYHYFDPIKDEAQSKCR